MNVELELNTNKIFDKIKKIIDSTNYNKPMKEGAKLLKQEAEDNFRQQGALYQGGGFTRSSGRATTRSKSWAPLAQSTKKDRVRKGYNASRPILERSGNLRNGFKARSTSKEASVTNTVSYAKYHNSDKPRKKIPQRKILGSTRKSRRAINLLVSNHIKSEIKRQL